MIEGRDFIVISLQQWDIPIGSNCKNIALELSKHNRVLYANTPLDRATLLRKRRNPSVKKRLDILNNKADDLEKVSGNLYVLYPATLLESAGWSRWKWIFDKVNLLNNHRFARQILAAMKKLGFKDPILFNDDNMFKGLYLKELLSTRLAVYYSRDNLLAMDYWKRHGSRIEPVIMKKYDMVITNSEYLADIARKSNPKSFNVGSGCDITIYNKDVITEVPGDIACIKHPIVGYAGVIYTLRLDLDLIMHLAGSCPEFNFVLIGPEDVDFRNSRLHEMKNFYFLGNKAPEELPMYINNFDVAINPQKINGMTIGNYPRKIDEYLALGKPVVATRTEAMSVFRNSTYLASGNQEFSELISRALSENSSQLEMMRMEVARGHSWENNVKIIYQVMEEVMDENGINDHGDS